MNNTHDIYYLSGLLHDIGKFYQRADYSLEQSKLLDETSKKIADYICPLNDKGTYAYQHVIWSYDFVQKFAKKFEQLGLVLNVFDNTQDKKNNLINLIAYHHKPNTADQAIIQLADWWASGIDRTGAGDYKKENDAKLKASFKEQAILNVFSHLKVNGKQADKNNYLKVDTLNLDKKENANANANSKTAYAFIWNQFVAEFEKLPTDSLRNFNYSLTYLLKKYTWLIPASTIDFPDNSLYDHLKLTGALSQIFYTYREQNPDAFEYNGKLNLKQGHHPVSMGCADLSGIQQFIYNISSKYAAKSLKGRSFYLQLLIETVQHEIMEKLNLQPGHFIYSSGGKMFFLFANTPHNHTQLKQIQQACESFLWDNYKGSLSLHIASVNFAYDNSFKNIQIEPKGTGDLGLLWRTVTEKISDAKGRKFVSLLTDRFDELFKPHDVGGSEHICAVSGEELTHQRKNLKKDKDDVDVWVSHQVYQHIKVGEALKGGVVTLLTNRQQFTPPVNKEHIFNELLPFGYKAAIVDKDELSKISSADHTICIKTIETDNNDFVAIIKGNDMRFAFRLYGGYDAPENSENAYKTFEELAGNSGYKKLGVLRMDVDNLGKLFISGFDAGNKSFSAYATLSGMLDWFFSGHINTIRHKPEFKDNVQIIYAGGDDLFAVGRWDAIIAFAETINSEFKAFTGRNDMSASGGISIVDAKFPIAKAADMAGEAEDKAKDHIVNGNKKNSLCLFGVPINWNEEFKEMKEWQDKLTKWLQNDTISKGLLMKFFDYYELHRNNPHDLSWQWNLIYQLARRMSTESGNKREALQEIQKHWITHIGSGATPMANFMVACRWAELLNRNNNN